MMNKYKLTLSITLLLLLLFSGCQDPIAPVGTYVNAAPAGMGYFSLYIGGDESSRTIMPAMPAAANLYYKLEFYKSGTTTNPKVIGPVSYTNLSTPVLLDVGTWDLQVSAYNNSAGTETQKTAYADKTVIVITSGEITKRSVELKPFSPGSGQGTFKWTISYPSEVSTASMTIEKTTGGTGTTYYFTEGTPSINKSASMPLDTGYYYVTFNLTMNGKTLERKELLHIYQNLESSYTENFTTENFYAVMTGIIIDPGSQTIYTIGEQLSLNVYAKYSDGSESLILDATTSNYNANTSGTQTVTITHTNTGFTAVITVEVLGNAARIVKGANQGDYLTLNEAIKKADNGSAGSPTEIIILRDITAPESDMSANTGYTIESGKNIKLTVESGQTRTITASAGNFSLFSVSYGGGSLTLDGGGGTLILNGNKEEAQSNRRGLNLSSGTTLMYNGVTITGFNSSGNGGGVYMGNATFTMSGGKITGNTVSGNGGGVYNILGTFTMSGGEISDNTVNGNSGGGVINGSDGTFTMSGGKISGNTVNGSSGGGGVSTQGTFTMSGGEISDNIVNGSSSSGGGVQVLNATFNMSGGKISGNTVNGNGGGVIVSSLSGSGNFNMYSGEISDNTANGNIGGGGVYIGSGTNTFTMSGGDIMNNTTATRGGGVYVSSGTNFTMSGGTIYGDDDTNVPSRKNTANGTAPKGAALYNGGTAKFSGNYGGGMYVANDVITTTNDTLPGQALYAARIGTTPYPTLDAAINAVTGGTADNPIDIIILRDIVTNSSGEPARYAISNVKYIRLLPSGNRTIFYSSTTGDNNSLFSVYGALTLDGTGGSLTLNGNNMSGDRYAVSGVADNGAFVMNNGVKITGFNGAGVKVDNSDFTFTMTGGTIEGNTGINGSVRVTNGGKFTMSGGEIKNNTVKSFGGGVNVFNNATFIMSGGEIKNNTLFGDVGSHGGGVAVSSGATFTMSGGKIKNNTASYMGGGVYVNSGNFTMSGGEIKNNDASDDGGGVEVSSNATFNMSGGEINNNTSGGNGGGVNISLNVNFNMSGGAIMNNTATGSGGGVFVHMATTFTMSGGTIYGIDNPSLTNKAPSGAAGDNGAALFVYSGGTANYSGTYTIFGSSISSGATNTTLPPILNVEFKMEPIPSGTFMMGSPTSEQDRNNDETQHSVTLTKSFYMGKYQVTQAQYQAVMGTNPSDLSSDSQAGETQEKRPVDRVSWYDAIVFCNKLSLLEGLDPVYSIGGKTNPAEWGTVPTSDNTTWNAVVTVADSTGYRLPTEAEWEYACRARTTTPFNTGNTISDNTGWYGNNSGNKTHEVGLKLVNDWGLYDMHGNVYEWCWDWYNSYSNVAQTDPLGTVSSAGRVLRGGDWSSSAASVRSAYRHYTNPHGRFGGVGFRLARTITTP